MRVLVTGATGFIGKHLVRRLLRDGCSVRCLIRPMSDTCDFLNDEIDWCPGDVRDLRTLTAALDGVDVAHHLALDFSNLNLMETKTFIEACLRSSPRRVVYYSSIAAVGLRDRTESITEETPCRPQDDYEKVKFESEQLFIAAHRQHGLPVTIVRPTAVYGPGGKGAWLPLFQTLYRSRFRYLWSGRNRISFCFIDNLIDGVMRVQQSSAGAGQTYLLSDERPYAFEEFAGAIAAAAGVTIPQHRLPDRWRMGAAQGWKLLSRLEVAPLMLPDMVNFIRWWSGHYPCSIDKARRELDYRPSVGLQEGVARTFEWYRRNGHLT